MPVAGNTVVDWMWAVNVVDRPLTVRVLSCRELDVDGDTPREVPPLGDGDVDGVTAPTGEGTDGREFVGVSLVVVLVRLCLAAPGKVSVLGAVALRDCSNDAERDTCRDKDRLTEGPKETVARDTCPAAVAETVADVDDVGVFLALVVLRVGVGTRPTTRSCNANGSEYCTGRQQ